jgi:hypothetical protein
MKSQIEELFNKEMTRKEFLQHVGAAVLVVLGISGLMQALLGSQKQKQTAAGYGSSAYGGYSKR